MGKLAELTRITDRCILDMRRGLGRAILGDTVGVRGKVTFEVWGPDGDTELGIKLGRPDMGIAVRENQFTGEMEVVYLQQKPVTKNLVVDEGDALIADLLQNTPEKQKLDVSNGYIAVGKGGTAPSKSATNWVQTPTGSAEVMDAGYPQTKGDWAAANDNVIVYEATFEAGDLNDTGIDEAVLANNTAEGTSETMAYAQMTSVDVTTADTLKVTWEITLLGA